MMLKEQYLTFNELSNVYVGEASTLGISSTRPILRVDCGRRIRQFRYSSVYKSSHDETGGWWYIEDGGDGRRLLIIND